MNEYIKLTLLATATIAAQAPVGDEEIRIHGSGTPLERLSARLVKCLQGLETIGKSGESLCHRKLSDRSVANSRYGEFGSIPKFPLPRQRRIKGKEGGLSSLRKTCTPLLQATIIIAALSSAVSAAEVQARAQQGNALLARMVTQLDVLEQWSRTDKSTAWRVAHALQVREALSAVEDEPNIARPLLAERFADGKRDRACRLNCAQMLLEMGSLVPRSILAKLEMMVQSETVDPLIRIYAAHFVLSNLDKPGPPTINAVLEMTERFMRHDIETTFIRQLVLRKLKGNTRATNIMLAQLKKGSELGPTFHTLGKIGNKSSIEPIRKLLEQNFNNRGFPKTRAYLALGEIGGPKVYNLLVKYLERENDLVERSMILHALGLCKDPRTKKVLLDLLEPWNPDHYGAALQGLEYLGDDSVIPRLEVEISKLTAEASRQLVRRTIKAIKAGGSSPDW